MEVTFTDKSLLSLLNHDSSVSKLPGYWLGRGFSLRHHIYIDFGAYQASYPNGTGSSRG